MYNMSTYIKNSLTLAVRSCAASIVYANAAAHAETVLSLGEIRSSPSKVSSSFSIPLSPFNRAKKAVWLLAATDADFSQVPGRNIHPSPL